MEDKTMVVLKSYAVIDGKLRSANEGPIEVSAKWAADAAELGLLDETAEVIEPQTGEDAGAATEVDAEAKAETEANAKPEKK